MELEVGDVIHNVSLRNVDHEHFDTKISMQAFYKLENKPKIGD